MKTHLLFICCMLLLLIPAVTFSQEPEGILHSVNMLGAALGVNDFHFKDQYLSPNIFRGVLFASRVTYQSRSRMNIHNIDAFFSTGKINSDLQPRLVRQYVGTLAYSYARVLDTWNIAGNPFEISAGTGYSAFISYTSLRAIDKARGSIAYDGTGYGYHAVNLQLRGEYQLGKHTTLSFLFSSPAFRLVSRPKNGHGLNEYNNEVNKNFFRAATGGTIEFLWDNLVLFNQVEYRQPLGETTLMHCTYWFGYASSDRPYEILSMGMYMNQFLIGIDWIL